MKNYQFYTIIVIFLLFINNSCYFCSYYSKNNDDFVSGIVIKVLDGDTYDLLLDDMTTIRVRMEGIDAPEKGMPYSKKATQYLGEMCENRVIKINKNNIDRYGRVISYSYLDDGRELSREMLKAGYAWHYKEYNSDPELAKLEIEAQQAKRGLWQDKNPIAPWEIRKMRRKGISTKKLFEIEENNR